MPLPDKRDGMPPRTYRLARVLVEMFPPERDFFDETRDSHDLSPNEKRTFKLFGNHVALRAPLPTEAGSKAVTRFSRPHDALRSPGPLRSSLGYQSLLLRHDVKGDPLLRIGPRQLLRGQHERIQIRE